MEIGDYAYVEARLASLEAQLRKAGGSREAYFMLYSGLSNLVDFLPGDAKPFVEWWIMKNDFENIKDAAAQILGNIRYRFPKPFIKVRMEALLNPVRDKDMQSLLDFLSNVFDGFRKEDFESLIKYSDFALHLDRFYFKQFSNFLPKKPNDDLARRLIATKVDLLNLKLLKRVEDLERFFLPYGFLSIEDIMDNLRLSEKMFELYGARDRDELENYYYNLCSNYDSEFASLMGFIISQERLIEKGM